MQLVGKCLATVISTHWAIVDWSWPKKVELVCVSYLHFKPSPQIFACEKTATTNIKERFQKKKRCLKRGVVSSGWSFIMGSTVTFFFQPEQSQWLRKCICCLYTDTSVLMLFLWGFQYCLIFNVVLHFVPVDSLLHGGDVAVYGFF